MGGKKSRKKDVKGPKQKLATEFDCVFCNFKKSVEVKLYKRNHLLALPIALNPDFLIFQRTRAKKIAFISCRVCGHGCQYTIHSKTDLRPSIHWVMLCVEKSEPIDVYCDWIDDCEEANEDSED